MSSGMHPKGTESVGRVSFTDIPRWGLALIAIGVGLIAYCTRESDSPAPGSTSGGATRSLDEPFEVSPVALCVNSGQQPPRDFPLAVGLFDWAHSPNRVTPVPFHRSGGSWCTVPRIHVESYHPQQQLLLLVMGDCRQGVKVWYHGLHSQEGLTTSLDIHPDASHQCRVVLQLASQPGVAERIPIVRSPSNQSASDIVGQ